MNHVSVTSIHMRIMFSYLKGELLESIILSKTVVAFMEVKSWPGNTINNTVRPILRLSFKCCRLYRFYPTSMKLFDSLDTQVVLKKTEHYMYSIILSQLL